MAVYKKGDQYVDPDGNPVDKPSAEENPPITRAKEAETSATVAPRSLTVAELKDRAAGMDNADELRVMLDDERAGENRKTAVDALEARIAEVEAD